MVKISHARVNYLVSRNPTTVDPENIHLPVHEASAFYSAELSLGTPQIS
jgi:hypothetical protein